MVETIPTSFFVGLMLTLVWSSQAQESAMLRHVPSLVERVHLSGGRMYGATFVFLWDHDEARTFSAAIDPENLKQHMLECTPN